MREEWTYSELKEIAYYPNKRVNSSELQPYSYVGVEHLVKDKGGVAFSEESPNVDSAIEYQANDILIGNIRPYLKKIWLADRNGGASGDVVIVRIKENCQSVIDAVFLYKALASDAFFEYDNANTKGAKMPRGDRNTIAKYLIPIPTISEQKHIVAELDLLQGIIDKQKTQLMELDTLAQSIFYDMFGDPVHNEKGWEVYKLGDVLRTTSGGTPSKEHSEYYENGTIPWVNSGDLHQMYIYDVPKHITQLGVDNSSAKLFPVDTVLVAMYGATVGETSILKIESTTNQAICGIFPNKLYIPTFLYCVLKYSQSYFIDRASGGAQPNISQGIIKNFNLISPSITEQHAFATKIESIEHQKSLITQSIAETQRLFDYTMDKYFG